MSIRCLKCFRPIDNCYCKYISPIDPGVKFVFLMHPHEAKKQRTGTGRLASLSLINSEIIIDYSFDDNVKTKNLINNSLFYPMVLYPGAGSSSANEIDFKVVLKDRTLLVFLIDATWREARRMMFLSPSLQKLPRLSFNHEYRSQFAIKKQPKENYLSTIESTYYLIGELQKAGVCNSSLNADGMMNVFKKMVNFQIACRVKRIGV
ncbi:MAG: DTW domain-containing protein [Spirochaetaceae bacterium]|nr:DTW domain-containing protein [Spirochaetaceae bacterium]